MMERVSVASSSVPATAQPQSVGRHTGGASAQRSLGPRWTTSNVAVQRMALEIGRRFSPASRALDRCAGGCTCGGSCSRHAEPEEELRTGLAALQRAVATRRTLARDVDQDPGPPELPDMKGLACGIKDGKPSCTVFTGKGDPLEIDPDSLSPEDRKAAFDPKRPKSCPPERWNWFWESCCPPGKRFDPTQKSCLPEVTRQGQPFNLPAVPPEEKGDFPLPGGDQAYA